MRKIIFCVVATILFGLVSCSASPERLDLSVENNHFNATPDEIVQHLNHQGKDSSDYVIPDFKASGEKIPVGSEGESAYIYLTLFTEAGGKTTDIKLELYYGAPEQGTDAVMQYLTLLLNGVTENTTYVSNATTAITDLISSGETNASIFMSGIDGVQIKGYSNPGYYVFNITAKELEAT